jgi:hypothetical protein
MRCPSCAGSTATSARRACSRWAELLRLRVFLGLWCCSGVPVNGLRQVQVCMLRLGAHNTAGVLDGGCNCMVASHAEGRIDWCDNTERYAQLLSMISSGICARCCVPGLQQNEITVLRCCCCIGWFCSRLSLSRLVYHAAPPEEPVNLTELQSCLCTPRLGSQCSAAVALGI